MASVVIDESLQRQFEFERSGFYRYSKILPREGAVAVTGTLNGATPVTFQLPVRCFNFSKSSLEFDLNLTATGASIHHILQLGQASPIDRIVVSTISGVPLMDQSFYGQYSALAWMIETKMENYLQLDVPDSGATAAALKQSSYWFGPGHSEKGEFPISSISAGTYATRETYTDADHLMNMDYTGPMKQHDCGPNSAAVVHYSIPFSAFYNSLLAVNMDLFFGENLTITITFAGSQRWSFTINDTAGTPVAQAIIPTISQIHINLAVEMDNDVINDVRRQVNSRQGLALVVPVVQASRHVLAENINSFSNLLTLSSGSTMIKAFTGFFNIDETIGASFEKANFSGGGRKVRSWNTSLNGLRNQDLVMSCADNEDYKYMRPLLKGSAISSAQMYKLSGNPIIDSFIGGALCDNDPTLAGGLKLLPDLTQIYEITVDADRPCVMYTFLVMQRTLEIRANSIIMV